MQGKIRAMAKKDAGAAARTLANVRRIVHAIHAQSTAIESTAGVTGAQLWVLRELARAEQGVLTLSEIAQKLALHRANAGRLVERLADKRLVKRETPAHDRRVVLVRLTKAGEARLRRPVAGPPQADLLARLE